jgi:tetratricopeptide (TPR) repeat protein
MSASNQQNNLRLAPLPIYTAANEIPSDWETLLQSAEAAEANNDDIQALNLYNQLLVLRPHNASIWNRHGLAAMRLQDFSTAVRSLSEAVRDYPINGSYYESLAWALLARGDYLGASERSRTAILMYQRENNFSLYPFFIRFIAEHAQDQSEQAALSLRYAKRNLRDRSWPLPLLEYLSEQLPQNQLLASVSNLREETEAHLIIGLREYFIGDTERGRQHLTWAAGAGDPRASGQAVAHAFRFNGLNQQVGGVF